MRSIPIMKQFGCPVVFDATHSVQRPGGLGASSGGDREWVECLALAAAAAGCDGLFLEVHPDPARARSDAATQVTPQALRRILEKAVRVREAARWQDNAT
jgi:2-dehydro-3-deoxyphosphooctonate aldolase (KDO 8-P synthase)